MQLLKYVTLALCQQPYPGDILLSANGKQYETVLLRKKSVRKEYEIDTTFNLDRKWVWYK